MRIGELAERTGTTVRALRHYEEIGLLSSRRASNGYRRYDDADLGVVRQIRALVEVGFTLDQTRPFVECLRDGYESGDSCPASLTAYRQKMREIEECIERLRAVHTQLGRQLHAALARHELSAAEPVCEHVPQEAW